MADRTFTLDEAQGLLPVLESLLKRVLASKKLMGTIDGKFQELAHRIFLEGGVLLRVAEWSARKSEREKAAQIVRDSLAEIDALGVQVKDLDIGLLDFPCQVGDQTILLCWKLGETRITHWHGTEEGFAGRKPIDANIANAGKPRRD
ncbi:MAG: DUF2203 domain-containing protein [Acidobacteria bacterium]|nr:DUF2203 domain-containing protein [Acidobacteriota bacterium]